MSKKLNPRDFLVAMKENTLKDFLSVTGMVKEDESNPAVLQFAPNTCDHWTAIPVSMIGEVEFIKNVPCKDHTHAYVRLHLNPVATPEGKALAGILTAITTELEEQDIASAGRRPKMPPVLCNKFCTQCQYCDDPDCDACVKCRSCR